MYDQEIFSSRPANFRQLKNLSPTKTITELHNLIIFFKLQRIMFASTSTLTSLRNFSSFSSSSIKGRTHFAKGAGSAPASLRTHPSTSVEYEQVTLTNIKQDSDKILSVQNFTHGSTDKFIIF
jgi:hypothetical protein